MRAFLLPLLALLLVSNALGGCSERSVSPERGGGPGSTCATTNDCDAPLVCVFESCVLHDYPIDPSAMACRPAPDCTDHADCTESGENCIDGQCERYCIVDGDCVSSAFVCDAAAGTCHLNCTIDDTCAILGQFYCDPTLGVNGGCRDCDDAGDCEEGEACKGYECEPSCSADVECGGLEVCDGVTETCEWVGCATDRECVFWTENPRSVCDASTAGCATPCEHDYECATGSGFDFDQCVDGLCAYIGCSSDAACRAAHGDGWVCGDLP